MTFVGVIDRGNRRASTPKSFESSAQPQVGRSGSRVRTLTVSAIVFLKSLDSVTELGTTLRADRSLLDVVITHRSTWLTDIARLCTSLGSAWIVAPVTTVAVLILTARRRIGMWSSSKECRTMIDDGRVPPVSDRPSDRGLVALHDLHEDALLRAVIDRFDELVSEIVVDESADS